MEVLVGLRGAREVGVSEGVSFYLPAPPYSYISWPPMDCVPLKFSVTANGSSFISVPGEGSHPGPTQHGQTPLDSGFPALLGTGKRSALGEQGFWRACVKVACL